MNISVSDLFELYKVSNSISLWVKTFL